KIRLVVFQVGGHLRTNNLRMEHKEGLCEKYLNALIVPPQKMLGKSQCHDDRNCCNTKRDFPGEIAFSIEYQPDYRRRNKESHECEAWLQQSKEESVYRDCSPINNRLRWIQLDYPVVKELNYQPKNQDFEKHANGIGPDVHFEEDRSAGK